MATRTSFTENQKGLRAKASSELEQWPALREEKRGGRLIARDYLKIQNVREQQTISCVQSQNRLEAGKRNGRIVKRSEKALHRATANCLLGVREIFLR